MFREQRGHNLHVQREGEGHGFSGANSLIKSSVILSERD